MRITLRKTDTTAGVGAELLALCSTITQDGSVSDEEIEQLRGWLDRNGNADIPAICFLRETVNQIIADGRVTAQERQDLQRALERVLPKELRESAKTSRRAREAAEYAREVEQRPKHLPLDSFDFMVAGVHYQGRDTIVKECVRSGQTVFLVREFLNPHSSNAVQVRLKNGLMIGYVPEIDAVSLAPLLDSGGKQAAFVKKVLTGGRVPIPVIVAAIYAADTVFDGALAPDEIQYSQQPTPKTTQAQTGCDGCVTVAVGVLTLVALIALLRC